MPVAGTSSRCKVDNIAKPTFLGQSGHQWKMYSLTVQVPREDMLKLRNVYVLERANVPRVLQEVLGQNHPAGLDLDGAIAQLHPRLDVRFVSHDGSQLLACRGATCASCIFVGASNRTRADFDASVCRKTVAARQQWMAGWWLQDVWLDNSILLKLVGDDVVKVPWPEQGATPTKKRAHAEMVSSRGAVASPASAEKSAKVEDALLSGKIDAKCQDKREGTT